LGWAWQVTATVLGERRKVQVYESALPQGGAEAEVRDLAASWCAEQAGRQLAVQRKATRLSDDELRIAEEFLAVLPKDATCDRIRRLASLRLTDAQLDLAEFIFKRLPDLTMEQWLPLLAMWKADSELPHMHLKEAAGLFLASRRVGPNQNRPMKVCSMASFAASVKKGQSE
jgi:hypothetical protein